MLDQPIAVLGAGNGGQCMAADLTLAGHSVHLYEHPGYAERLVSVIERGTITLTGIGRQGTARIELITTDLRETIQDAMLVNIVIPAYGQETFFRLLVPELRDGQVVVVWAGDFGSLYLRKLLDEERPDLDVTVYETHTLPYGVRLLEPGHPWLLLSASNVLAAALPAVATGHALGTLISLFPCLTAGANVLQVALNNPNPIVHPAGSLLNTGRIQYSAGKFAMYREGITEAVARVIRSVFYEIEGLARAIGVPMLQYEERDFRSTASIMGASFEAGFDTIGVIASVEGPHTVHDRYITEDLPFGLVPVVELAQKFGVETPLIRSLIEIGSHVCQRNFWMEGRGLSALGLADLDREGVLAYVGNGKLAGAT